MLGYVPQCAIGARARPSNYRQIRRFARHFAIRSESICEARYNSLKFGHHYTPEDGAQVFRRIYPLMAEGKKVVVSFAGVNSAPSSFVNEAFIKLLEHFPFERIEAQLSFSTSTKQINQMLRKRFAFETQGRILE